MKIHQIFFKNSLRNFCYLVEFKSGVIFCIDPFTAHEVLLSLENKPLKGIINTHDHCDHYSGNSEIIKIFKCPVLAHVNADVPDKTRGLTDQEIIYSEEEWLLRAINTPGHTMSHLCLLLEKDHAPYAIFTGDCFFNAGVGNCHHGGNPEVMYETISEIFSKFNDDLLIYPGHEYLKRNLQFTLDREPENHEANLFLSKLKDINSDEIFFINNMQQEREINTFLRLENLNIRKKLNLDTATNKKVFLTLRELRNKW